MSQVKPGLREVLRDLSSGNRDWPLFLHGETGTGKTSAALALADFVDYAVYNELEMLCTSLVKHEFNWDPIAWATLAILDEIGLRDKSTDLSYTAVKTFWELRQQRDQKTIYISNVEPDRIRILFDDRIASRLLCGTVIEVTGDDRRRVKK